MKIHTYVISIILFTILCNTKNAFAASIFIQEPTQVKVGSIIILPVFLDTQDSEINAIEGSINITGQYKIKTIQTSNSVFSLWPQKPSFDKDVITFTGGSPSGISGSRIKLFEIAIELTQNKPINFSFKNVYAYKNDGLGTKTDVAGKFSSFAAQSSGKLVNELVDTINTDKTQPEPFTIIISRDNSVFDGKYFASFTTNDKESGINRYEIIENKFPLIRASSPYILQDQSLKGNLTINAIDNAGNIRSVTIATHKKSNIPYAIILIALIVLITVIYNKVNRK